MSKSPFKMQGFSGFGNSPLKQEEEETRKGRRKRQKKEKKDLRLEHRIEKLKSKKSTEKKEEVLKKKAVITAGLPVVTGFGDEIR